MKKEIKIFKSNAEQEKADIDKKIFEKFRKRLEN